MSSIKRRKVDSTATRPGPTTRGIAAFAKVSKAQVLSKSVFEKNAVLESAVTINIDTIELGGKRKLQLLEDRLDGNADQASRFLNATVKSAERTIRPLPQRRTVSAQPLLQTPCRPVLPLSSPLKTPGSVETPTNGARALLDKFFLQSPPSSPASSLADFSDTDINNSSQTTVSSSHPTPNEEELPTELQDLVNLHSSFLTALTLHYAHNGTHTPADLWLLCPDVTRAWGKRKVVIDDIRRTLAIMNNDPRKHEDLAELSLSDYGHGKICIEMKPSGRTGRIAKPLDENRLNALFSANLSRLWQHAEMESVKEFLSSLSLEPITICSSLTKMSPLLAKGQRRLEDLKNGITIARAASAAKIASVKADEVLGKRPTLLERLRLKAAERANAPPPPSKEELDRRAALGRLDEVVAVLTLLTTSSSVGQSRVSFTLPTVLGKLKDSFKTPVSRQEGDVCVRLLAAEIAPEWLKVVKMGRSDMVVVIRENRPGDEEIRERIAKASRV